MKAVRVLIILAGIAVIGALVWGGIQILQLLN